MSQIRIIIQSRLSSSRLPAKAILPLSGLPTVVLCAKRAGNTGLEVMVAVSTDSADDIIVETIANAGIKCIRGPLENVLARFEIATRDLPGDAVIVRLTADNMFPDGTFVEQIVSSFIEQNLEYLGTNSPQDGLPYGMSAEVFRVWALREALAKAENKFDYEHVTPWLRQHVSSKIYKPQQLGRDLSHLRCTLDTYEDYLRLHKIFTNVIDPVAISWMELCNILAELPGEPRCRVPFKYKNNRLQSELTLGTVQLGMKYGIANQSGQPSADIAKALIRQSVIHGISTIDTARAYGEAETRIGESLTGGLVERVQVITKLDPLATLKADDSEKNIRTAVDASILRSCRELRVSCLPMVLLHRWPHYYEFHGEIWRRLLELKAEGIIQQLGVSVQSPEEALQALQEREIKLIQLPFNILDWRWKAAEFEKALEKRTDILIHTRSTFLQGILISNPKFWPLQQIINANYWVENLDKLVKEFNRENRADLCIAYVRAKGWIDSIVLGMETVSQLYDNIRLFQKAPLSTEEVVRTEMVLKGAPENLLNPACWNQSR